MVDFAKIKQLREKLGMSQADAATAAGLSSRQQWYHIESGRQLPTLETLAKVATALRVRPKELLK